MVTSCGHHSWSSLLMKTCGLNLWSSLVVIVQADFSSLWLPQDVLTNSAGLPAGGQGEAETVPHGQLRPGAGRQVPGW